MAEVSVADTGVGIAPEDQAAVFEGFRQVGTADKKAEGTGLGLALSRKFIELHGGRVWVQSQLGAVSTFSFALAGALCLLAVPCYLVLRPRPRLTVETLGGEGRGRRFDLP
jgi:signal transduction histidine kinase